jgi:hypothetical protein
LDRVLPAVQDENELLALSPSPGDTREDAEDKLSGALVAVVSTAGRSTTGVDNVADLRALDVSRLRDGQVFSTAGYYTPGDGGGALYKFVAGSSATHDGGSVISPTGGASGRFLLVDGGEVNVRQWGALGTYTNGASGLDDTARLQAAITYATTNGRRVYLPAGNYGITASLKIAGNTSRWSIVGDGAATTITQRTISGDGAAIFEFTGTVVSDFTIEGLYFFWYNPANVPASGFKCCGFLFANTEGGVTSSGVYNFQVRDVSARFGFRFASNYDLSSGTSSGVNVWCSLFEDCSVSYFNGGAFRITNSGSGSSPNFVLRNVYIQGRTDGQAVQTSPYSYAEEQIYLSGVTAASLEDVEINAVRNAAAFVVSLIGGPGSAATISNCRVEGIRLSTTNTGVLNSFNVGTTIVSMDVSAIYVDASLTVSIVKHTDTDGAGHKLVVLNLDNMNNGDYPTLTAGAGATVYVLEGTPGGVAFVGNLPAITGAIRFGGVTPNYFGQSTWRRNYAFVGGSRTPQHNYTNDAANYFSIESATATVTIGAIVGAVTGQEYVFEIINSGGTLTTLNWNAAYLTAGDTLPVGSGKRKTVRFIYNGTNFVQIGAASPSF